MDPVVLIIIAGILLAALMGGQANTPPPPTSFIFIPQPSAPRSESGCLPLLVLGLLALVFLAAATG
jgi:hypothetical protein